MNKYAYLIIANRNHFQLQKLITMLDDSRNDIYLMIDKKANNFPKDFHTEYSTLNYLKSINIYWGSYSQIEAELRLFEAAAPEHYTYYHLLSGVDLPLVNQDKIHNFFDSHLHKEFLTYGNLKNIPELSGRLKHYLFRKHLRGVNNNWIFNQYRRVEHQFLKLCKSPIPISKIDYASNWVSIDDTLLQALIKDYKNIQKIYKFSNGADELFIPIFLNYHPRLKKRVYKLQHSRDVPNELQGNLRYINWWDSSNGASPYTWKMKDYSKLIRGKNLGHLFSRKFDEDIDNNIINKIFNDVMNS